MGNQWCFGMKMPVGTDRRGVIHAITKTDAATADITHLPEFLHAQETTRNDDNACYKPANMLQRELSSDRYR